MKKIFYLKIFIFTIILVPKLVFSASLDFDLSKKDIRVGDTIVLKVKINTEGETFNTIEGQILIDQNSNVLSVSDFNLSKSQLTLWPETPSLSEDGKIISFVGGLPGGFNLDDASLFNIILEAKNEGSLKIKPKDFFAFINDGYGNKINIDKNELNINVLPKLDGNSSYNEWLEILRLDDKSPEKFSIIMGEDKNTFDGKKFIFFNALDDQSGISHYEVKENNLSYIRSGNVYVLQNQNIDKNTRIEVVAYDNAGNKTISIYEKQKDKIIVLPILGIFLIIIIWFFIKINKNVKNK